jgi:hypothetical protein
LAAINPHHCPAEKFPTLFLSQLARHLARFRGQTTSFRLLRVIELLFFAGWLSHNEWKLSDSTAQRKLNAPTLQKDNRKQYLNRTMNGYKKPEYEMAEGMRLLIVSGMTCGH